MLGKETGDGEELHIIGQLRLDADRLTLKVVATDGSGNTAVETRHLHIRGRNSK